MFPVQPLARIEHVTLRGECYCIDVVTWRGGKVLFEMTSKYSRKMVQ
jgi:hypothetical protein